MPLNTSEALERALKGEEANLELREVRFAGGEVRGPLQSDLADEFAAFANGPGGAIALGVHGRTRTVVGIPVEGLDKVEEIATNACQDSIDPPVHSVIQRLGVRDSCGDARTVILVQVRRSQLVHRSPGGYLRRVGSSKRQMSPENLAMLFRHRSRALERGFEQTPVTEASLRDLDVSLCERFRTACSQDDFSTLLSKLAMARTGDQGILKPTVAGVLLGCRQPERFLPNAMIQAVSYRGTRIRTKGASTCQRDARDIQGPLDVQIFEACDFVNRNMSVHAHRNLGGGLADRPQFDMVATFEAIANAVAHRDYSMRESKVRLHMFDDRLELHVPGALTGALAPETLPFRRSARNEVIVSLLARCPLMNRHFEIPHRRRIMDIRAGGVSIILERSEELSGRVPEYRLNDVSGLTLTIFGAGPEFG